MAIGQAENVDVPMLTPAETSLAFCRMEPAPTPTKRAWKYARNFPVLETEQLCLRCLRPEDAEAIFAYKSQPLPQPIPRIEIHRDISQTRDFIRRCLEKLDERKGIYWAITLPTDDVVIGTVALLANTPQGFYGHQLESSCELSPDFRLNGYMKEARVAVIKWAFGNLPGLQRIHSEVEKTNAASLGLNKSLGFKCEGLLRSYCADGNQLFDIQILSLLRSDFEEHPLYH